MPPLRQPFTAALHHAVVVVVVFFAGSLAAHAQTARCLLADGFDFPVGKPDAVGYHKARGYTPNGHLGEDWNGNGGGDSDLGDPIYATARGVVVISENVRVGWGNCIIIRHAYREHDGSLKMVDSLYGHLDKRIAQVGDIVERGQKVGTMGSNFGQYPVHLHFELRKNLQIGMNRSSFARDNSNYWSPTPFINAHRTLAADFAKVDIPTRGFADYGKSSASAGAAPQLKPTSSGYRIPVYRSGNTISAKPPGQSQSTDPVTKIREQAQSRLQGGSATKSGSTTKGAPPPVAQPPKEDWWTRLKNRFRRNKTPDPGSTERK